MKAFTPEEIETEARDLYEGHRANKPAAVGGFVIPRWDENEKEDVREAWKATAVHSLTRRRAAVLDMRDRCAAECDEEASNALRFARDDSGPVASKFVGYAAKHIRELDA